MTYIVQVFLDRSAAASASLNLARCLFAVGGTSFIIPMVDGIEVGLAFTTCTIFLVFAWLSFAIQWKFAGKWRITATGNLASLAE